jgi:translation initiation factor 2 gamma subunit (eIF-2gamma)
MAVETASDRAALLADFGEPVKYNPTSGSVKTITAIFDNIYEEVEAGGTVGVSMQQPRLFVRTDDITGATEGDAITVRNVAYTIRVIMSDGLGMTELVLEKD